MTRFALIALLLAALAGCAAPQGELSAPMLEPAFAADAIRCTPDDGIGGTGCPVE